MTIQWKEPQRQGNRKWPAIVEEIRSKPGEWAYVGNMNVSLGYKQARQNRFLIRVENRQASRADVYLCSPKAAER